MKKTLLVLATLVAMFIVGCGGASVIESPEISMVVMHETMVSITWNEDTVIEGNADFDGYNVYVSTDSSELLVHDGEDLNKFNADPITDLTYDITGLSQDTVYYFQVRTVNVDDKVGDYNADVPFVEASPRPEFTAIVKFEMNTPGVDEDCAIRFSDATLMADSAMANSSADMWVDVWPTSTKDTTAFDSPSHSTQWGIGANVSLLLNLGQYEFEDINEVTTEPTIDTYVEVVEGDLIILKTADEHYVKIHLDLVDRVNDEVTITYAYQNIANYPHFAP
ncbi:MAG: fibronectin type III domain-containing protein [bacterium]